MYSERLMAIVHGATHQGELVAPTHCGVGGTPGCGPYIELLFRVEEGVVREARFQTYGCPTAMACAEIACTFSEGKSLARLGLLTAADLAACVGGVPEGKEHCPQLATLALARVAPLT
jgi:NifU-like protein involved in Fe-S cluster formation